MKDNELAGWQQAESNTLAATISSPIESYLRTNHTHTHTLSHIYTLTRRKV